MSLTRAIAALVGAAVLVGCGGERERDAGAPEGPARCVPDPANEGAALFAEVGCLGCHTYADEGSQNMDAPDLTAIGETDRPPAWYADHLRDPPEGHPSYASLEDEQLLALGEFLHASRGC